MAFEPAGTGGLGHKGGERRSHPSKSPGGACLPEMVVLGHGGADAGFDCLERGVVGRGEGGAVLVAGLFGLAEGRGVNWFGWAVHRWREG